LTVNQKKEKEGKNRKGKDSRRTPERSIEELFGVAVGESNISLSLYISLCPPCLTEPRTPHPERPRFVCFRFWEKQRRMEAQREKSQYA
jgi:hypothetical protein